MPLRAALITLLALVAVVATADSLPVGTLDGGGGSVSASGYRLSGSIGGYALPSGGPRVASSLYRIDQGFQPSAAASIPVRNAADPFWLGLDDAPDSNAPRKLQ